MRTDAMDAINKYWTQHKLRHTEIPSLSQQKEINSIIARLDRANKKSVLHDAKMRAQVNRDYTFHVFKPVKKKKDVQDSSPTAVQSHPVGATPLSGTKKGVAPKRQVRKRK